MFSVPIEATAFGIDVETTNKIARDRCLAKGSILNKRSMFSEGIDV